MDNNKHKTYRIKTVQDIYDLITRENYKRFTAEFGELIRTFIEIKETLNSIDENATKRTFEVGAITWIDDDEKNLSVTIKRDDRTRD